MTYASNPYCSHSEERDLIMPLPTPKMVPGSTFEHKASRAISILRCKVVSPQRLLIPKATDCLVVRTAGEREEKEIQAESERLNWAPSSH